MTSYGGRPGVSFWRTCSDRVLAGFKPASGELRSGDREGSAKTSLRRPEGFAKPRSRRIDRRTESGPHSTVPARAPVLRVRRAETLPRASHGSGTRPSRTGQQASPEGEEDREAALSLTARSRLPTVARAVAEALEKAGIRAVLTGGACACIHTGGEYESEDLDFLIQSAPSQAKLDEAMASIGFERRDDQYFHKETRFFVEFPAGPLGIGRDLAIKPIRIPVGSKGSRIRALSATDSCRDRLAAFYHWADRQSLRAAVQIALRNRLDIMKIRAWSAREGASEGFTRFLRELETARRRDRM